MLLVLGPKPNGHEKEKDGQPALSPQQQQKLRRTDDVGPAPSIESREKLILSVGFHLQSGTIFPHSQYPDAGFWGVEEGGARHEMTHTHSTHTQIHTNTHREESRLPLWGFDSSELQERENEVMKRRRGGEETVCSD